MIDEKKVKMNKYIETKYQESWTVLVQLVVVDCKLFQRSLYKPNSCFKLILDNTIGQWKF